LSILKELYHKTLKISCGKFAEFSVPNLVKKLPAVTKPQAKYHILMENH
jgi:hypothetical protein